MRLLEVGAEDGEEEASTALEAEVGEVCAIYRTLIVVAYYAARRHKVHISIAGAAELAVKLKPGCIFFFNYAARFSVEAHIGKFGSLHH